MAERLLKVKGTQLYYQDYSEVEHLLTGAIVDGTFDGNLKVKGTYLHYMDNDGVQRRLLGILTGETLAAGRIKNKGDYLYYGDINDDERYIGAMKPTTQGRVFIGTSVWGQAILNQCMITRTPNGDLYASCGDMGQNLDLDPSTGHPIEIWYSDDDGATWVVSKTIYVDDFHFGGGGNGVCIASDGNGLVHVAFAVRRGGIPPEEFKSRNIIFYLHGKHGDWGAKYNIFQLDLVDYPLDCLPKVTSIAVDSNDLAHILYAQYLDDGQVYVWHLWDPGGGTFSNTIIADDTNSTLGGNRLVIDGDDTVSVVYGDVSTEKYYYKQKPSGGGWSASEWIGMGGWLLTPAIAVDRENTKHIAIFEGALGKYRTRSSAGVWGDVEQWIGTQYAKISISILPDGTVYIVGHKTYYYLIIRKRDPSTGTWSTEELWDETGSGWGVCMLHSYWPLVDGQHVCIFDAGWAFHWRPNHTDSYYWADP